MQEKYLLPSPDVGPEKPFPPLTDPAAVKTEDQWPSGSSELLTGLTDDNRKLVGYMIPWDPWVYHHLFTPTAGGTEVKNSCRIMDCLLGARSNNASLRELESSLFDRELSEMWHEQFSAIHTAVHVAVHVVPSSASDCLLIALENEQLPIRDTARASVGLRHQNGMCRFRSLVL